MIAPVILVEAHPRRPSDASVRAIRLAGAGDQYPYRYGGKDWWSGILRLPSSSAKLDFDGEQMSGGGVPNALELLWQPAENERLDDLASLWWQDAPVTVWSGAEGRAMPPVDTIGKVADVSVDGGVMRITLADLAIDLKRALLVDRFLGTGGLEGPTDFEGQIKARAWGRCWNVPGRQLIAASNVWCFGHPLHPWLSFDQVRDRGVPASQMAIIGWHGSAEATLAVLVAADAPAGGCVVCPSIACVKWWTRPAGDLHADIRGETAGGYVETAPEIASRIVAARSTLTFAAGAIAAAVVDRPAAFGYRVADESTTAAAAVSEILGDVGLSWIIHAGAIEFRRWDWTAPVRVARSEDVSRRELVKLAATKRIGYRRNQASMARGDLAGIVLAQDVVFDDGSTAAELNERLTRIVSDSWLSQGEKPEVIRAYAGVTASRDANEGLYQAFSAPESVTPARNAAATAIEALSAYLVTLAPPWGDVTVDTPVNGAQFTSLFATAHARLQGFSVALAEHAGRVADWDLVKDPNGTKPHNNADVTGDNTAKDTANLGGRPAAQVLSEFDIVTGGYLSLNLRQDELLQVIDARTLTEGQPTSVKFLDFRNQQIAVNLAAASRFSLLGAETADGTGWNLNLASVYVGQFTLDGRLSLIDEGLLNLDEGISRLDGSLGTLSSDLTELGTKFNGVSASVTLLREAFVGVAGSYAKAVLRADADGIFGAVSVTASGANRLSRITFVADELEFVDPNGGNPTRPFFITNGKVYAPNLVVETIEIGAVGTEQIAAEGIRKSYGAELASNMAVPLSLNQRARVLSLTVNKARADSAIFISSMMRPRPARDYACQFQYGRTTNGNDTVLDTVWFWMPNATINDVNSLRIPVSFMRTFFGIPAGAHTFWVDIVAYGGGNSGSFLEAGSNIDVEERKR
jgi:hypothetical protein